MLYPLFPMTSERGLPLDVAAAFDFEEVDPTVAGTSLILNVRAARGDASAVLELRSDRGEIAATHVDSTKYAIALYATRAQMDRMAAGKYVYGLAVIPPDAPPIIMIEGTWEHLGLLVAL